MWINVKSKCTLSPIHVKSEFMAYMCYLRGIWASDSFMATKFEVNIAVAYVLAYKQANVGSVCPFSIMAVWLIFSLWQPYLFSVMLNSSSYLIHMHAHIHTYMQIHKICMHTHIHIQIRVYLPSYIHFCYYFLYITIYVTICDLCYIII